jgi:hypothetical protein
LNTDEGAQSEVKEEVKTTGTTPTSLKWCRIGRLPLPEIALRI